MTRIVLTDMSHKEYEQNIAKLEWEVDTLLMKYNVESPREKDFILLFLREVSVIVYEELKMNSIKTLEFIKQLLDKTSKDCGGVIKFTCLESTMNEIAWEVEKINGKEILDKMVRYKTFSEGKVPAMIAAIKMKDTFMGQVTPESWIIVKTTTEFGITITDSVSELGYFKTEAEARAKLDKTMKVMQLKEFRKVQKEEFEKQNIFFKGIEAHNLPIMMSDVRTHASKDCLKHSKAIIDSVKDVTPYLGNLQNLIKEMCSVGFLDKKYIAVISKVIEDTEGLINVVQDACEITNIVTDKKGSVILRIKYLNVNNLTKDVQKQIKANFPEAQIAVEVDLNEFKKLLKVRELKFRENKGYFDVIGVRSSVSSKELGYFDVSGIPNPAKEMVVLFEETNFKLFIKELGYDIK